MFEIHQEIMTALHIAKLECERIGVMAAADYEALLADAHKAIDKLKALEAAAVGSVAPAPAAPAVQPDPVPTTVDPAPVASAPATDAPPPAA